MIHWAHRDITWLGGRLETVGPQGRITEDVEQCKFATLRFPAAPVFALPLFHGLPVVEDSTAVLINVQRMPVRHEIFPR
jgi:hypothetical protein